MALKWTNGDLGLPGVVSHVRLGQGLRAWILLGDHLLQEVVKLALGCSWQHQHRQGRQHAAGWWQQVQLRVARHRRIGVLRWPLILWQCTLKGRLGLVGVTHAAAWAS